MPRVCHVLPPPVLKRISTSSSSALASQTGYRIAGIMVTLLCIWFSANPLTTVATPTPRSGYSFPKVLVTLLVYTSIKIFSRVKPLLLLLLLLGICLQTTKHAYIHLLHDICTAPSTPAATPAIDITHMTAMLSFADLLVRSCLAF